MAPAAARWRPTSSRTAYDFDPLHEAGAGIGLGAFLVTDTATCMVDTARFFLDWSSREACGKAVPCRIGTKRLVETLDRILAATPRPDDFNLLRGLSRKMADTALCKLEARRRGRCSRPWPASPTSTAPTPSAASAGGGLPRAPSVPPLLVAAGRT